MRCLDRHYLILYIEKFEDTKNSLKIPKGQHYTHKTKDNTLKYRVWTPQGQHNGQSMSPTRTTQRPKYEPRRDNITSKSMNPAGTTQLPKYEPRRDNTTAKVWTLQGQHNVQNMSPAWTTQRPKYKRYMSPQEQHNGHVKFKTIEGVVKSLWKQKKGQIDII